MLSGKKESRNLLQNRMLREVYSAGSGLWGSMKMNGQDLFSNGFIRQHGQNHLHHAGLCHAGFTFAELHHGPLVRG